MLRLKQLLKAIHVNPHPRRTKTYKGITLPHTCDTNDETRIHFDQAFLLLKESDVLILWTMLIMTNLSDISAPPRRGVAKA